MEMFESTLEHIYLLILILSIILAILYFFFGEALVEFGKISPFLHPSIVLPFLIFFSGTAYILQSATAMPILLIAAISIAAAAIICSIIYYLILLPKSRKDGTP